MANGNVNEENDPVVREIPVFLSKNLLQKLYVLQYPLRSVAVEIDKPNIIAARIKPKLQEVELELELPTKTSNYDQSKGEQICINADGPDKYDKPDYQNFFKGSVMDKIIYTSTKALLDPGRFAVGILIDNELHLNPLHGILHVKPSFPYLDKSDKALKDAGAEPGESGDEEEVAEQVTVKFARTETDRSKALREKSYGFLQKKNAEELWINTKFFPLHSEEAKLERNNLICGKPDLTIQNITLPKDKYISQLIGPNPDTEEVPGQLTPGAVSMCQIKTMPTLVDKVKHLMANVKLISFNELCTTLQMTQEPQKIELLKPLQQVAELVQGNWVVKSEILYPSVDKEKAVKLCGITGIHPEIISKARDYVCGIILGSIILYLNSVMTKLCCHQLIKSSLISRRRNYEVLGIIIPNVEFVLGLVGATLGTAVCSVAPAWIYLQVAPSSSGERWIAKVVLVCGLGILILGTAANIYAEEEYSEIHAETILPPNLKEIEAKFDSFQPQPQQDIRPLANNHNRLGDNSFNDPLSFNRSAFDWDSTPASSFCFFSRPVLFSVRSLNATGNNISSTNVYLYNDYH
nr:EOG090X07NA [Ceriodaphnia reticulata]